MVVSLRDFAKRIWTDKNLKKPVVLFGENEAGFSFVDSDNYQGIVSACKHALDTGYQHLVYIGLELKKHLRKAEKKGT